MSQRLLLGLLVVMLIGTIFFVVEFSRKPEMVELLPQAAKPEEISTMVSYLKSNKYTYEVQADKILVPVEQAYEIRGGLAAAQALPENTTAAFTALAAANDFMMSDASVERRWNVGTQEVLARTIRNYPYIANATVVIARGQPDGIGRPSVPTSASISVRLKGSEGLTSNQVAAIVDLVAGAVAGLKRENIHLTDGLKPYRAPSEDSGMAGDTLEYTRKLEADDERRLAILFEHLGDVKIAVNVVPDMLTARINKEEFDKPVKAEVETSAKDTATSDGAPAGGGPGVVANTAQSASAGSSGRGGTSTMSDTTAKNDVRFGKTDTTRMVPPGTEITDKTATISVPRSYFQAIYQRMKKDEKAEPSDAELKDIITENAARIREQVRSAIGIKADEKVTVDWFYDALGARPMVLAGEPGILTSKGMGQLVTQYAKQAVLACIAVGGLMMMLMMVRRAAPSAAGSEADTSVFTSLGLGGRKNKGGKGYSDQDALDVGDDVIGEAGQGEAVLTGIELDDETLQSRKMVDEVSIMIKENPENAATLVKKWMKGK